MSFVKVQSALFYIYIHPCWTMGLPVLYGCLDLQTAKSIDGYTQTWVSLGLKANFRPLPLANSQKCIRQVWDGYVGWRPWDCLHWHRCPWAIPGGDIWSRVPSPHSCQSRRQRQDSKLSPQGQLLPYKPWSVPECLVSGWQDWGQEKSIPDQTSS